MYAMCAHAIARLDPTNPDSVEFLSSVSDCCVPGFGLFSRGLRSVFFLNYYMACVAFARIVDGFVVCCSSRFIPAVDIIDHIFPASDYVFF